MKKIFLTLLLLLFFCFNAYGASSEDVYLRQDVFNAKIEALFARIDGLEKTLSAQIAGTNQRIDAQIAGTNQRIDGTNQRIDDLHNFFYLILVGIGLLIAMPFIPKAFEVLKVNSKPSLTIEEVKQVFQELMEEREKNIRFAGK